MLRRSPLAPAALALAAVCCAPPRTSTAATSPATGELRIHPGDLPAGPQGAITDVAGVTVGHVTLVEGDDVRTGVTAIVPHPGNVFSQKVPAAIVVANGFGKLVGSTQVEELGQLETPILLTNTLQVWDGAAAIVTWTLAQPGNEDVRSVNPVVGETNDGWLSDIRARALRPEHFAAAIAGATAGPVPEGSVGAGTGTVAFGYKGGIGTASRRVADHTVGVLVQTNFGGELTIEGVRIDEGARTPERGDGSCMIVIATDAPLDARQLGRLARRSFAGMARTGASFAHGSGDYAIAFSTAEAVRIPAARGQSTGTSVVFDEPALSPLFIAVADATEEAIVRSLLASTTTTGHAGHTAPGLSHAAVKRALAPKP